MATASLNRPLLAGYFGHGNAGDEMILHLLRARLGPVPFVSGPRPLGGPAVSRFRFFDIFRALRRSCALVLGGGELFQSRTSLRSLLYYWSLPLLARLLGRPVAGFSLALDPDMGRIEKFLTAFVLRKTAGLWVRDEASAEFLSRCGVASQSMPDIVWAWPVSPTKAPDSLRRVLWIPRFTPSFPPSAFGKISAFSKKWEHGVMALHPAEDGPDLGRFRAGLPLFHRLESWADPGDVFQRMARYDLVVSMRYHGLVAAVLAGRPAVAIPDHGKVRRLAQALRVPMVEPAAVDSTDWERLFVSAVESGPPSPGDRPARAAMALDALAAAIADNPLHN